MRAFYHKYGAYIALCLAVSGASLLYSLIVANLVKNFNTKY